MQLEDLLMKTGKWFWYSDWHSFPAWQEGCVYRIPDYRMLLILLRRTFPQSVAPAINSFNESTREID